MRRSPLISRPVVAGALVLGLLSAGCGDDRVERGLSPANEQSTPESAKELEEPAAERQEETTDAMQGQSDAEFDKKEEGGKPATP